MPLETRLLLQEDDDTRKEEGMHRRKRMGYTPYETVPLSLSSLSVFLSFCLSVFLSFSLSLSLSVSVSLYLDIMVKSFVSFISLWYCTSVTSPPSP